mgnify:FL=1
MINLISRAEKFLNRIALREGNQSYSYEALLNDSRHLALNLLGDSKDLNENRVAFMVTPGFDYVKTQWAIWQLSLIHI